MGLLQTDRCLSSKHRQRLLRGPGCHPPSRYPPHTVPAAFLGWGSLPLFSAVHAPYTMITIFITMTMMTASLRSVTSTAVVILTNTYLTATDWLCLDCLPLYQGPTGTDTSHFELHPKTSWSCASLIPGPKPGWMIHSRRLTARIRSIH